VKAKSRKITEGGYGILREIPPEVRDIDGDTGGGIPRGDTGGGEGYPGGIPEGA